MSEREVLVVYGVDLEEHGRPWADVGSPEEWWAEVGNGAPPPFHVVYYGEEWEEAMLTSPKYPIWDMGSVNAMPLNPEDLQTPTLDKEYERFLSQYLPEARTEQGWYVVYRED